MDELRDLLFHPARWVADASELRPSTRAYLALVVLGITVAASVAAGALSSRWAHRRTREAVSAQSERTIVRLRRNLVALVIFFGGYLAVEVAPLPARLGDWLSGVAFVLGALVCARLSTKVVALLITSSLTHVSAPERTRLEREYVPLVEKVTTLAVFLILVIVVAKHFGKDGRSRPTC